MTTSHMMTGNIDGAAEARLGSDMCLSGAPRPQPKKSGRVPPPRRRGSAAAAAAAAGVAIAYKRASERPPVLVERRNARERERVELVNGAFKTLQQCLPTLRSRKKRVSKLKILRAAIEYMYALQDALDEAAVTNGAFVGMDARFSFQQECTEENTSYQTHLFPSHDGSHGYVSALDGANMANIVLEQRVLHGVHMDISGSSVLVAEHRDVVLGNALRSDGGLLGDYCYPRSADYCCASWDAMQVASASSRPAINPVQAYHHASDGSFSHDNSFYGSFYHSY